MAEPNTIRVRIVDFAYGCVGVFVRGGAAGLAVVVRGDTLFGRPFGRHVRSSLFLLPAGHIAVSIISHFEVGAYRSG